MNTTESYVAWFDDMVDNCLAYAQEQKACGRRIVGITCEYTPRELIIAAGGVPVSLCGGFLSTIAAAERQLPTNLCPLVKSTFGFSVERANPFLEMADLVVAETTCDGKKKMFELMADTRPMHILDLPQKADDDDAMAHWVREVAKLRTALEQRFATHISEDKLRTAIAAMNRERAQRRTLATLLKSDVPPLSGRDVLKMKSLIACMPLDAEQYESALRCLATRQGRTKGQPPVRVLLTGVPMPHGAEKVIDVIESRGGLVVCQENCTGLKPLLEDVDATADDPLRAIAEKYFHLPCSVMTRNTRRLASLRDLAREYRAECVVDVVWQCCLTYDVESHYVRRLAEEDLGLPYLRIETDYSPSDTPRLAMRVQALFETISASRHRSHPLAGTGG